VGSGVLLLGQLDFAHKLGSDPVATRLFDNLLNYCATYTLAARRTTAVFPASDTRLSLLKATGLKFDHADDVLKAVEDAKAEIVIADATPANLAKLAGKQDAVKAFTARGGQLMLWGVTPDGLASFNKLVGVEHALRPFKMERVSLAARRDLLMAGLTARDVVLEGTEKIYPWAGDRYPANDTFTYVVDLDDVAPFVKPVTAAHGWSQMTNGLTSADSWKFIFYHDLSKEGAKPRWTADLPRAEEVVSLSVIINAHYHRITKLKVIFDENEKTAVTLDLKPEAELRQDFTLKPVKCKRITLVPVEWSGGNKPVLGIDNLWINIKRGENYAKTVVPLLNVGGLVRYRQGKGGIILNELRVPASEPNPVNAQKKQTIVATMLRNLGASFAAEERILPGTALKYTPVPLAEKCTQYLTSDKGWLKDGPDLGRFPVGEQRFGGVPFVIRDFKTSPLPSCIMLAGPGVKGAMPKEVTGIPVNAKADVLFFLHTFVRQREWHAPRNKPKTEPPAVFEYVVHYADGQKVIVPVRYDRGVGHWLTREPQGLPEASVAWAAPFAGQQKDEAVVYQMPWTNPRRGQAIRSIDVRYSPKDGSAYGVPAVLGITTAVKER
jgi:beta-galactosidase